MSRSNPVAGQGPSEADEMSASAFLAAVKGSQAEKRLASQFIARFFKYFPKLQENAIDAMLDLCEDEDNMVSFKTLAHFCPQVSHLTCLFHTFMCN